MNVKLHSKDETSETTVQNLLSLFLHSWLPYRQLKICFFQVVFKVQSFEEKPAKKLSFCSKLKLSYSYTFPT